MLLDREKTGPENIDPYVTQMISETLQRGFCPGTAPNNYRKYENLLKRLGSLPSHDQMGGKVDLESGQVGKWGIFSVVDRRYKGAVEETLANCLMTGRGDLYCPVDTLWSSQTLKYIGNRNHILRTTTEGTIEVIKVDKSSDDEKVVETIESKDIRYLSIAGTGDCLVEEKGNLQDILGVTQNYLPRVLVDSLLAGKLVTRIALIDGPDLGIITDVVVIGSDNRLLERTLDWS